MVEERELGFREEKLWGKWKGLNNPEQHNY